MSDSFIVRALAGGLLRVDMDTGAVFAPRSNTPMKPVGAKTRKGYLRTCVNDGALRHFVMLHRVVCVAAHGTPVGDTVFVNHKNGIKTDNRPANLEWVSHVQNMAHSAANGLHAGVGRRDGCRDNRGRFDFKHNAGRLLDGRTWDEFPEVSP